MHCKRKILSLLAQWLKLDLFFAKTQQMQLIHLLISTYSAYICARSFYIALLPNFLQNKISFFILHINVILFFVWKKVFSLVKGKLGPQKAIPMAFANKKEILLLLASIKFPSRRVWQRVTFQSLTNKSGTLSLL